jgi:hypothetical protein
VQETFSPDITAAFPELAIEYARAAATVMSRRNNAPKIAPEAVAAEPQPSFPTSAKVVRGAAANHIRFSSRLRVR